MPEHEVAVIETGMNHFGEIRYLGDLVQPDVAVISNIGDAHIEFLGSREGILQAKCEIFEHLKEDGAAVLCGDDPLLNTLDLPFETIRCGKAEHCGVRVSAIHDGGVLGIRCTVETGKATYHLDIPAPGEHMIYSASMAAAVGEHLGLTAEEIVRGVAAYQPSGSRMRVVRLDGGRTILDDCYNANPQSVTAALEILAKTDCAAKVAVLGDMGELGDLTPAAHRAAGELAAQLGLDAVVAIGPKSRDIAAGGGSVVQHFLTIEEAMPAIHRLFTPETTVLVKASHAMEFGKIVKELEETYQ